MGLRLPVASPLHTHAQMYTRAAWHDSFIWVPWLIRTCAIFHSYMCHDSFIHVPWLSPTRAMTHLYTSHDAVIHVPWLIHMSAIDSFIHEPRRSHTCAMTHSYMCHDSFMCVPRFIHTFAMTDRMASRGTTPLPSEGKNCVPWLIHTCAMTHSCVCHDSIMCVPWLIHTCAMTHRMASRGITPSPSEAITKRLSLAVYEKRLLRGRKPIFWILHTQK